MPPQPIAGATRSTTQIFGSNLWVELARWKAETRAKGNLLEGMFEIDDHEIVGNGGVSGER